MMVGRAWPIINIFDLPEAIIRATVCLRQSGYLREELADSDSLLVVATEMIRVACSASDIRGTEPLPVEDIDELREENATLRAFVVELKAEVGHLEDDREGLLDSLGNYRCD